MFAKELVSHRDPQALEKTRGLWDYRLFKEDSSYKHSEYEESVQDYKGLKHNGCDYKDPEYKDQNYGYGNSTIEGPNYSHERVGYKEHSGDHEDSRAEGHGYEASGRLAYKEWLQIYEEYINEISEPIYDMASFEEFWAGQEKGLPAEKDPNWQGYTTGYAIYALTKDYHNY